MGKKKIVFEPIQEDDRWPICPHCNTEIKKMKYLVQAGIMRLSESRLYVCPHCMKVLGTGVVGGS